MREAAWTEWVNSPETQALIRFLRRRKAPVLDNFLAGNPVLPISQGRAAAFSELEVILTKPVNEIHDILGSAK